MDTNIILKNKGIKTTPNRIDLIEILNKSQHPLSVKEIENELNEQPDRVTLYRNLKLLVENEVLHKIEVNGTIISYTLNPIIINKNYNTEHLHFHCNICNKVICMPQCEIKKHELPDGFTEDNYKLIVDGTCNICNKIKKL